MAPSPAWTYFKKLEDKVTVKCLKCTVTYKKPATSTLYYHLSHVHGINLKKNPPTNQRSASSNHQDEEDEDNVEPRTQRAASAGGGSRHGAVSHDPSQEDSVSGAVGGQAEQPLQPFTNDGPLNRCWSTAVAFSAGGQREKNATDKLVFMIAKANLPLCFPENEFFRMYSNEIQPLYKVPCKKTTTKILISKYEELKDKIGTKLSAAESLSLTVDIWTHQHTMQSYLGMTAHCREGTQIVSYEIGATPMSERKTAENLQLAICRICEEWQIDHSRVRGVVCDGGANIKAAVRLVFGSEKQIDCFAHQLNCVGHAALDSAQSLPPSEAEASQTDVPDDEDEAADLLYDLNQEEEEVVNDMPTLRQILVKLKKTVRFFRTSEIASNELRTLQMEMGKAIHECLKLLQSVRTRWNSDYYMLDRYLVLADLVNRVLLKLQRERSSRSKPPSIMTGEELEILTEARDLLKPLEEATKMVSKEKAPTLSNCIPIVYGMKTDINEIVVATGHGFNLKQKLLDEIEDRFSYMENSVPHAVATVLDPRYKKFIFESPLAASKVIAIISKKISEKVRQDARIEHQLVHQQEPTAEP